MISNFGQRTVSPHIFLLGICSTRIFLYLCLQNYTALIPVLQKEWQMSNAAAGSVVSAIRPGSSFPCWPWLPSDWVSPKKVFFYSSIAFAASCLLFAFFARSYLSAFLLRGLMGLCLGGTYTPEQYVVVHPGASGAYKVWPPDRYAELISHIDKKHHLPIVLLKGEMDDAIVRSIKQHLSVSIIEIDCLGKVHNLAAMLQRAALCLSNDSGPRHLTVAVGTPLLAFFRHHHDKEWDVYHDVESCVTLKGEEVCPACPAEKCFDRMPEGEQYGAHCVRQVSAERKQFSSLI